MLSIFLRYRSYWLRESESIINLGIKVDYYASGLIPCMVFCRSVFDCSSLILCYSEDWVLLLREGWCNRYAVTSWAWSFLDRSLFCLRCCQLYCAIGDWLLRGFPSKILLLLIWLNNIFCNHWLLWVWPCHNDDCMTGWLCPVVMYRSNCVDSSRNSSESHCNSFYEVRLVVVVHSSSVPWNTS